MSQVKNDAKDLSKGNDKECFLNTTGTTMDVPIDRRIQRTRQLLRDALFLLIVERGYEGIAIQDITEQANLRTNHILSSLPG